MELFPGTVNRVWVSCPPKNSRVTTFYTVLKPKFEILKERDTQIPLRSSILDFNEIFSIITRFLLDLSLGITSVYYHLNCIFLEPPFNRDIIRESASQTSDWI
jgi:hypothetical protein